MLLFLLLKKLNYFEEICNEVFKEFPVSIGDIERFISCIRFVERSVIIPYFPVLVLISLIVFNSKFKLDFIF